MIVCEEAKCVAQRCSLLIFFCWKSPTDVKSSFYAFKYDGQPCTMELEDVRWMLEDVRWRVKEVRWRVRDTGWRTEGSGWRLDGAGYS